MKGQSGKLQTTLIGDYMTHSELSELEQERKEHFEQLKEKKDKDAKAEISQDYVPIDFDAYTIRDKVTKTAVNESEEAKNKLSSEEKIWRISSLTASVDDETRILILPLPESKRQVKIADTEYRLSTYNDLGSRSKS